MIPVFQYVDEYRSHDAIGQDINGIQSIFQNLGHPTRIICRILSSPTNQNVSMLSDGLSNKRGLHILHYGGYGFPLKEFRRLPGPKWLRYHNITPPEFFTSFTDNGTSSVFHKNYQLAKFELTSVSGEISLLLSPSQFNISEMEALQFKKSIVFPPAVILSRKVACKKEEIFTLCFLGRFAPNKRIEDLMFLLYFLRKKWKDYKLKIIGNCPPAFVPYYSYLLRLREELGLLESVEIILDVDTEKRDVELSRSHAFISMSEHEGFCIPLLEAMAQDLPVLAFSAGAIEETLRGSGIVFREKNFPYLAELIHSINMNKSLVDNILEKQRFTLEQYRNIKIQDLLQSEMENL